MIILYTWSTIVEDHSPYTDVITEGKVVLDKNILFKSRSSKTTLQIASAITNRIYPIYQNLKNNNLEYNVNLVLV